MRKQITTALSSTILGVTCLIGLPSTALAVDGVILIDQNRANAGNVTPGDMPGFPVTISQPGSYRLASNLILPSLSTTAIEITTNGVTLDLNGFSISGLASCNENGTSCTPIVPRSGLVAGVWVHPQASTTPAAGHFSIKNGTIQGVDGIAAIFIQSDVGSVDVRDMKIFNNTMSGIFIYGASFGANIVSGCSVYRNGGTGIYDEANTLVIGNSVTHNAATGLTLGPTSGYKDNVLSDNGQVNVSGGINLGANVCNQSMCP